MLGAKGIVIIDCDCCYCVCKCFVIAWASVVVCLQPVVVVVSPVGYTMVIRVVAIIVTIAQVVQLLLFRCC